MAKGKYQRYRKPSILPVIFFSILVLVALFLVSKIVWEEVPEITTEPPQTQKTTVPTRPTAATEAPTTEATGNPPQRQRNLLSFLPPL